MKISEVGIDNGYAIVRGWVGSDGAATDVLIGGITDGATATDAPSLLEFAGLTVTDLGSGVTLVASSWKIPVRCATTANGTLATAYAAGQVVDGITLATSDRILVKNQTSALENGIYTVNASGVPSRSLDLGLAALVPGAVVDVLAGTTNAASLWICTNQTAPVLDTDAITFALVNGGGTGTFELAIEGGQDVIKAHGNMGATETFDPTDGNVHTGTLDANCTFTLSAPSGSGACSLELWLTEDSTGGRTVTWPGSVTEQGDHTTTALSTQRVILETVNSGAAWLATWIGSGIAASSFATPAIVLGTAAAAGVATTTIRSDATIVAFDATVPTTSLPGDVAATGSAATSAHRDHLHGREAGGAPFLPIGQETRTSDGATVTWLLDNDFEESSVQAFNLTSGKALAVTETVPNTVVIGAAGAAGDVLSFAYAASVL